MVRCWRGWFEAPATSKKKRKKRERRRAKEVEVVDGDFDFLRRFPNLVIGIGAICSKGPCFFFRSSNHF